MPEIVQGASPALLLNHLGEMESLLQFIRAWCNNESLSFSLALASDLRWSARVLQNNATIAVHSDSSPIFAIQRAYRLAGEKLVLERQIDSASEWRPVLGFEGWYEVSNLGFVRRLMPCKGVRVGRVLRFKYDQGGYRYVELSKEGVHHKRKIHRLVAEAFISPRPHGMVINHIDCDILNNRPDNLEYVTQSENVLHTRKLGRTTFFDHPFIATKLSDEDVVSIRNAPRSVLGCDLAKKYAVAESTISRIRSNQSRKSAA